MLLSYQSSDTEVMREVRNLRNRYDSLSKNVQLREDNITDMYEVIRQYEERNKDLQGLLDWSRPIKARLKEPIPNITDVASLQNLIADHKVRSLQSLFYFTAVKPSHFR